MISLDSADRTLFTPHIGETFEAVLAGTRLPLTLAEVRPLGPARPGTMREPFALTFHAAPALRLPQRIHRLENAALGAMEIFLVQTGADASASHFEAIFN